MGVETILRASRLTATPAMPSRRFPPPWSADEAIPTWIGGASIVRDANGQALAYVYFEGELDRRSAAHFRCWGL